MKNLLKNKLFVLFSLFFILFSLFLMPFSYGHVSYYDSLVEKANGYKWVLFTGEDGNTYLGVGSNSNTEDSYFCTDGVYIRFCDDYTTGGIKGGDYYLVNDDFSFTFICNVGWQTGDFNKYSEILDTSDDIYYMVVYGDTTNDNYKKVAYNAEDFFQAPPKELTLEEVAQLAEEKIVPVILLMITTTVGLVICVIGLKKGFRILVNGLKT